MSEQQVQSVTSKLLQAPTNNQPIAQNSDKVMGNDEILIALQKYVQAVYASMLSDLLTLSLVSTCKVLSFVWVVQLNPYFWSSLKIDCLVPHSLPVLFYTIVQFWT